MKSKRMKYLLAAVVVLVAVITSCKLLEPKYTKADVTMAITTSKSGKVSIWLEGSGTAIIDWGDGSRKKYRISKGNSRECSHIYNNSSPRTIAITGNNITYLGCYNIGLTNLDVSKNVQLTELSCKDNQLTNLDVSSNLLLKSLRCEDNQLKYLNIGSNVHLERLHCWNNQLTSLDLSGATSLKWFECQRNRLTSLDVSKNIALIHFFCNNNLLISLDMSNNTELKNFGCSSNLLSSEALNSLFETLHGNTIVIGGGVAGKDIYVGNNPGTSTADLSIAKEKGWTVYNW